MLSFSHTNTDLPPDVVLSDLSPSSQMALHHSRKRKVTAMQRIDELMIWQSRKEHHALMEASSSQHSEFLGVLEMAHAEERLTNHAVCELFREAVGTLSRMSQSMSTVMVAPLSNSGTDLEQISRTDQQNVASLDVEQPLYFLLLAYKNPNRNSQGTLGVGTKLTTQSLAKELSLDKRKNSKHKPLLTHANSTGNDTLESAMEASCSENSEAFVGTDMWVPTTQSPVPLKDNLKQCKNALWQTDLLVRKKRVVKPKKVFSPCS